MQRDFNKSAAAMVAGTEKAIAAAVAPLLKRIEDLEARPIPTNGKDGVDGKDGVGVAGALIDRSGVLVLTLSDGTTRDLGEVIGKDGKDGKDGLNGKDGNPGEPGRDGFGLDDFDVNPGEDGRTVILSFTKGEVTEEYELKFPIVLDKGVYKAGDEYEPGDGCSFGGHYWIAQRKTSYKPDGADSGWRMAVRRGRDGKDAK